MHNFKGKKIRLEKINLSFHQSISKSDFDIFFLKTSFSFLPFLIYFFPRNAICFNVSLINCTETISFLSSDEKICILFTMKYITYIGGKILIGEF